QVCMAKRRCGTRWPLVLVGLVLVADPSLAQAEDPFQSAPGPEAPKLKPHPRASQPRAVKPVAPAPPVVVPAPGAEQVYSRYAPSGVAARVADKVNWDNKTCGANPVD